VNSAIAIVALSLSLITSIVAVTAVIVQMRTNMATLSKQSDRQDQRDDSAAKELSELFALLKCFISAQTEINKSVELGLRGAINKLEEVDRRTAQQSAIVELLTEALKRSPRAAAEHLNIEP
jgi:hypothetical protein